MTMMLLTKSEIQSMFEQGFPNQVALHNAIAEALKDKKYQRLQYLDQTTLTNICYALPPNLKPDQFYETVETLWKDRYTQHIATCPYIFITKEQIRTILTTQNFADLNKKLLLEDLAESWHPDPMHYGDFNRLVNYLRDPNKKTLETAWKTACAAKEQLVYQHAKKTKGMKLDKQIIQQMIELTLTHMPAALKTLQQKLQKDVFLDSLTKMEFVIFLNLADYSYPSDYKHDLRLEAKNLMMQAWKNMEETYQDKPQEMLPPAYDLHEEVKFLAEPQLPVQPAAAQSLPTLDTALRDLESTVKTKADLERAYALLDRLVPQIQGNAQGAQQPKVYTPSLPLQQQPASVPAQAGSATPTLKKVPPPPPPRPPQK